MKKRYALLLPPFKKVRLIFLFFCMILTYSAAAAPFHFKPVYNYDSVALIKQLKATKSDTGKLNLLFSLAFHNNELVESPSFIDTAYLKQLIKINERASLFDDKPFLTLLSALKEGVKANYPSELTLLKTAVNGFDQEDIQIPMLLIEARWIFNVANQQEEKYRFYTQKLSYYLQKGQNNNAAACYHCLAGYYVYKGDLNSAINNYLRAGELFKSFSHLWYMHEFAVVAQKYTEWGNLAKSRLYFQKALAVRSKSAWENDMYSTLAGLIQQEYELKHYATSLAYMQKFNSDSLVILAESNLDMKALNLVGLHRLEEARKVLDTLKSQPAPTRLERAISNSGLTPEYSFYKYYVAVGDMPKAEAYLQKGYAEAKQDANVRQQINALKELAKFYGDQEKTQQAWEYSVRYNRLNDSLQASTNSFNVASYENEQKENEQNKKLILLRQQHAVQEATISQRNIIIWISMLGLLLVIASLVFIYRQLQINKRNLAHLKTTQTQLIQSEKMASLGELTAGIAHEIQNPLNFVNNFSEVSVELLDEMEPEIKLGQTEMALEIAGDVKDNLEKIRYHGKRADAIVKGMLQHSRTSSRQKEPTDINALADEYVRLAYHGVRAKVKDFNAELITSFDPKLPKTSVIPQDIGRVLLNLINNAFYAVQQKANICGTDYKPKVEISTSQQNQSAVLSVKDNGIGIPENIREKIMQPFFTTKPTGEGTGLGLSLSYDIVVKGHGGRIDVDTKEGEYTEFTIILPL